MKWIKIGALEEFPAGKRKVVMVEGKKILVINHKGKVYAMAPVCPHMRLPLKRGIIEDETIVCPWHHSSFDLNTGEVKRWAPFPPGVGKVLGALSKEKPLPLYPAKIEKGNVWVTLEPVSMPKVS